MSEAEQQIKDLRHVVAGVLTEVEHRLQHPVICTAKPHWSALVQDLERGFSLSGRLRDVSDLADAPALRAEVGLYVGHATRHMALADRDVRRRRLMRKLAALAGLVALVIAAISLVGWFSPFGFIDLLDKILGHDRVLQGMLFFGAGAFAAKTARLTFARGLPAAMPVAVLTAAAVWSAGSADFRLSALSHVQQDLIMTALGAVSYFLGLVRRGGAAASQQLQR